MTTPIYPLTLTLEYRSADQKVLLQNAQGNVLIQGEAFLDQLGKRGKIDLISHQRQQQRRFCVEAEKAFSFKPTYEIWDEQGRSIGAIQWMRQWVSWQRDECHVYQGQQLAFKVRAAADHRASWVSLACVAVMIAGAVSMAHGQVLLAVILIGLAGGGMMLFRQGYLLNPTYIVQQPDGRRVMQFVKVPSMQQFRSQFTVQAVDRLNESAEFLALLGLLFVAIKAGDSTAEDLDVHRLWGRLPRS
jgi:hypothetical protein